MDSPILVSMVRGSATAVLVLGTQEPLKSEWLKVARSHCFHFTNILLSRSPSTFISVGSLEAGAFICDWSQSL